MSHLPVDLEHAVQYQRVSRYSYGYVDEPEHAYRTMSLRAALRQLNNKLPSNLDIQTRQRIITKLKLNYFGLKSQYSNEAERQEKVEKVIRELTSKYQKPQIKSIDTIAA